MKVLLAKALQQNKKLFLKFFVSLGLTLCIILTGTFVAVGVSAAGNDNETRPIVGGNNADNTTTTPDGDEIVKDPDKSALYELIGVDASEPIEVIILITLLSVAPSFMIMLTSFTRIIIVLSFLRSAMQTNTTPPNMILTGIALFLTVFVMWPVFSEINEVAYVPYSKGELSTSEAIQKAGEPLKTFMLKQTTNRNMKFFLDLQEVTIYSNETVDSDEPVAVDVNEITLENYQSQLGFQVVIPAFIISELTRAFQMGFMLFIPFLVIDLVVSSTLMSMGMMMLPP
ncbi:MAG: EscR/YscR/HrcR family type III secretion system export apparatus protein, partial [Ruminiclostridium sp.]|nr:EscR/YscR/HrcR family type III secretion system export apparatus protein [Ruminiclostridium sp.]